MSGEPKHAATDQKMQPRQFSLAGLLGFMVLCSLYCAQFAMVRAMIVARDETGDPRIVVTFVALATILSVWLVFYVFYDRLRPRGPVAAHCVGPVAMVFVAFLFTIEGQSGALVVVPMGCFVSSAVSFPLCAARLARRIVWREPPPD
jgi:hypothetical protein